MFALARLYTLVRESHRTRRQAGGPRNGSSRAGRAEIAVSTVDGWYNSYAGTLSRMSRR